jgi:signal transduction histidine kinase
MRGVIIVGLIILGILLPHGIYIIADFYAALRVLMFAVFSLLISGLLASLLNFLESQLEAFEEIAALNEDLNGYIARLESTQRQLVQSEKLNAIGQLAASVAHEINNPLAGVLVYTKLLIRQLTADSFEKEAAVENLRKIKTAIDDCSYIVRSLLDFSRQSEPELKPVKIDDIISRVMALVNHQAEKNHVHVSIEDLSVLPPIVADGKQLQQVFVNLVVNAIQAMPEGGELVVRAGVDGKEWLTVSVRDTGCGIEPENMDRLFDPFFTTRKLGEGTGLGLSISYGIIKRHGGDQVERRGRGSMFTVFTCNS